MAREDDLAYLSMMKDLGKEPEKRLLNQNSRLEKRLIYSSILTGASAWLASYIFLGHLSYPIIFILAACNAYCLEWLCFEVIGKLSFRPK